MSINPCKDCNLRNPTCHIEGNCKPYDTWKKDHEEEREQIKRNKETHSQYQAFTIMCRNIALREQRFRR